MSNSRNYFAVFVEKRYDVDEGWINVYFIEKRAKSKATIKRWIENKSRFECVIMTENQYNKALESESYLN